MPAEVGSRFLPVGHQEVLVRRLLRRDVVVALIFEPAQSWIVRTQSRRGNRSGPTMLMPVERIDHQIFERVVQRPGRTQTLGEPQMEMVHHRLVAGNGLNTSPCV